MKKIVFAFLFFLHSHDALSNDGLTLMAGAYQVDVTVLQDYVESYNFKCPSEISVEQLSQILDHLDEDTPLSVMLESAKMDWRDIYVEARSGIECLTPGSVSKGY